MSMKKYLDYEGLGDVASHVNTRLKTVTVMPLTAKEGAVRLYVGTSTTEFKKGHTYQWNTSAWVDITDDTPHVTGTYNEIQSAISSNEVPDGAYVGVTDDYDQNVEVGIYSTDETKTGEIWIDGKPIYRKVYNVPNTSSVATWLQFDMNTPGFKEVVRWSGYSVAKATGHIHSGCQRLLGFAYYGGAGYMGGVTVYGPTHATMANTIGVFEGDSLAAETDHYIIILEYTKTTD